MPKTRSVEQSYLRWLPLVFAAALIAIGVALGLWQLARAEYKLQLQQRHERAISAAPVQHASIAGIQVDHRIELRGRWRIQDLIFLDNRSHEKRAGYHVLMPLELASGEVVIVNRGWLAAHLDRSLPDVVTPTAGVTVQGITRDPAEFKGYSIGQIDPAGRVWLQLDMNAWQTRLGKIALAPVLLMQENAADDGLVRVSDRTNFGVDKHRAYAFQWFSLATTVLLLSLWYLRKQMAKDALASGR